MVRHVRGGSRRLRSVVRITQRRVGVPQEVTDFSGQLLAVRGILGLETKQCGRLDQYFICTVVQDLAGPLSNLHRRVRWLSC